MIYTYIYNMTTNEGFVTHTCVNKNTAAVDNGGTYMRHNTNEYSYRCHLEFYMYICMYFFLCAPKIF